MLARVARVTIVVPCYNEADRLDGPAFLAFVDASPDTSLLFVDDGSKDATSEVLAKLAAQRPASIRALSLQPNRGKAEAVRQGMQDAIASGADVVGYLDADLATPTSEMPRLRAALDRPGVQVAIGARVALLGTDIHRSAVRHYLGRVFASGASLILQARIYDTQCGAKLFRTTPAVSAALAEPFLSRWAFDVEFLGRLLAGTPAVAPLALDAIVEVPLAVWHDIKGSKLGVVAMARTLKDLARIAADLAARRRAVHSRRQP
jgi:glycosyltransferase involved in cell wall biosynthesis